MHDGWSAAHTSKMHKTVHITISCVIASFTYKWTKQVVTYIGQEGQEYRWYS